MSGTLESGLYVHTFSWIGWSSRTDSVICCDSVFTDPVGSLGSAAPFLAASRNVLIGRESDAEPDVASSLPRWAAGADGDMPHDVGWNRR